MKEKEYGCKTRKNGIGPAHIIATTKTAIGPLNTYDDACFAIVKVRQRTTSITIDGPTIVVITKGLVVDSAPSVLSHANENQ